MGKGDTPRPIHVDREVFERNWERTFRQPAPCSCGHTQGAHAMSYREIDGQYCKLCPCTSYRPERTD